MFTKADVMRLSGLGEAVVDRLILFDILDPVEARYCFKDIASAREVARLLQNGATEESIIAAGARLRDRGSGSARPGSRAPHGAGSCWASMPR